MKNILITGSAGFIGYHLIKKILSSNSHYDVVGLDSLNDYYDVSIKKDRLSDLKMIAKQSNNSYKFINDTFCDGDKLDSIFSENKFDMVVHLGAQAGVRYSITNPSAYIDSNIYGFFNILESCRKFSTNHFLYASSSSVYGANTKQPFSTLDMVDSPVSLYAASKKSNELMAYSYSHLYKLSTIGLRFFTVYGPFGRPDMAYYKFTKAILNGEPIEVFNHGNMERDFTYIDDVIECIERILKNPKKAIDPKNTPYKIYNVGNNKPVKLNNFINAIEKACAKKAIRVSKDMQLGDVVSTYADVSSLIQDYQYSPSTSIEDGIVNFVSWYKRYYEIK